LATGPLIVLVATGFVLFSLLFAPARGLVWSALRGASQRRTLGTYRVLVDLLQLGREHRDLRYASEQGMLDTYLGRRSSHVLRRLERRGLVVEVQHMPEEGAHWVLTDEGVRQAQALSSPFGEPTEGLR
jgi:manganese/zinc/iron transport system permease protein